MLMIGLTAKGQEGLTADWMGMVYKQNHSNLSPVINADMLVTYEGIPGALLSNSNLAASTFGCTNGTWSTAMDIGEEFVSSTNITNIFFAPFNMPLPESINIGGTLYSGAGSSCAAYDLTNANQNYTDYVFWYPNSLQISNCAVSGMLMLGSTNAQNDFVELWYDSSQGNANPFLIMRNNNADFSGFQQTLVAHAQETNNTTSMSGGIILQSGVPYFFTLFADMGLDEVQICIQDTNLNLIGCAVLPTVLDHTNTLEWVDTATYLVATGGTNYLDNMVYGFNQNAQIPMAPITVPPVTNFTSVQVAENTVILSWQPYICMRYTVSRYDGTNTVLLTTNLENNTIMDTTVSTNVSYIYSVMGQVGNHFSTSISSPAVELVPDYTPTAPDLLWIKTGEGAGVSAGDSSGNSNGMALNPSSYWTNGPVTGTYAVCQAGAIYSMSNTAAFNPNTNIVTLSWWQNAPISPNGDATNMFSFGGYSGHSIIFSGASEYSSPDFYAASGFYTGQIYPSSPFPGPYHSGWHNYMLTVNNSTGTLTMALYVDGNFIPLTGGISAPAGNFSPDQLIMGGGGAYGDVRMWSGDQSSQAEAVYLDYQ